MRYFPAFALFLLFAANSAAIAEPAIEASPAEVLEGEPVRIMVSGLAPFEQVTLHASRSGSLYPKGHELYRGQATFTADSRGRLDLRSSQPMVGSSYDRPDAAGLFWSMVPVRRDGAYQKRAAALDLAGLEDLRPGSVMLEAEVSGKIVARAPVMLRLAAPDVTLREIRDADVVGVFARNESNLRQPAVILLGGSEGGLFTARELAPLIASHGYSVLGLGYFRGGEDELLALRPNLELIPVETIEAAHRWLAKRPDVDASRIAIVGVSKGAEFALLAGATFGWIKAIAAFAPSHVVWEGIPPDDRPGPAGSSWTFDGNAMPFVRWSRPAENRGNLARAASGVSRLTEVHLESLVEHADDIDAARIPIEKSQAAIFIAAGQDDGMWPSAYSAEQLQSRLARRRYPHPVQVEMLSTGHQILGTGWGPTTAFHRPAGRLQGGNPRLDAEAQAIIWPKLLSFLAQQLRPDRPDR